MLRSPPGCLLAALSLLACEGVTKDPGGESTTGVDTTSATPTTGAPGASTAESVTTSETAGDATTGAPGCPLFEIEARPQIAQVMLVLDKSGSMVTDENRWDHDGDDADDDGLVDGDSTPATARVTRWRSLHETVAAIVGESEPRTDFGAVLFPAREATKHYDAQACLVHATPEVPVGPDQGAQILATIPPADAVDLYGGTPATAGVLAGLAGLAAARDPEVAAPQYLVLVTDGAANCAVDPVDDSDASLFEVYDEQLASVVADALAKGVPTFVVGIAITAELSGSLPDATPT